MLPKAATAVASSARAIAWLVGGSVVSTVCYAVTIRAGIGLGPLYTVQDGLSRHTGLTIGQSVTVVGLAMILGSAALRVRPGPGTIAVPFLGGFIIDALLPHMSLIASWPAQWFAVIVASWFMALGGAMMIKAAVGITGYDGIMVGINARWRWPVGRIRLVMEASMVLTGAILGGAIGAGTIITGVVIAPGMQFWLRRLRHPTIGAMPARASHAMAPEMT